MKVFKNFDEQLDLLISRGCVVDVRETALNVLKNVNYYRFTAYFIPFRNLDSTYKQGVTFNKIHDIYQFDTELRHLLFAYLEEIEIYARTNIAYIFSEEYGVLGYLEEKNFNQYHNHRKFIENFEREVSRNNRMPFVQHHLKNYGGKFPLWVGVELFTFGTVSKFYADMLTRDKKLIARKIYQNTFMNVQDTLWVVSKLRNYCAHYQRLYYTKFSTETKNLPVEISKTKDYSRRLFAQIYAMKTLYHNKENWNNGFMAELDNLIQKYKKSIHLHHVGFPEDWKEILTK